MKAIILASRTWNPLKTADRHNPEMPSARLWCADAGNLFEPVALWHRRAGNSTTTRTRTGLDPEIRENSDGLDCPDHRGKRPPWGAPALCSKTVRGSVRIRNFGFYMVMS